MKMSGYQTALLYRGVKLHFISDYDFIKYKGKVKYSREKYEANKHKFSYEKLSKKFHAKDLYHFMIANFLESNNVWIQELVSNIESYEIYTRYQRRIQSLSYVFKNDVINTLDHDNVLISESGEYPVLLKMLLRNEVCMETVIIMDRFMEFLPDWEKNVKDDTIFPIILRKLKKYGKLLQYDEGKFKSLLSESYTFN